MTTFGTEFNTFTHSVGPESRLRLAPTPSGYLHAGNALNFILNWLSARLHPGARLLLRIDDLDADRKRPEYVQDVFDTLHWLGLDWDEGPSNPDDFEKNWSQHLRLSLYQDALDALRAKECLFACGKSRRDLESFAGKYPPEFREQHLSLDDPDVAWRIRTPDDFPLPDFIVRRRDGLPAYQIASLADDMRFRITHIIRGDDLHYSTEAQLFMARCLDWTAFSRIIFLHHPLLQAPGGEKLSKSAGATALHTWRREGRAPAEIFQMAAGWLGLPVTTEIRTAQELLTQMKMNQVGNT